ncbi:hypothetical protein KGF54_005487 [Candida jiufengensis]|uniref:uncharacterized protein n=1 Tax=Candida jiufengensis TaxID=497108 RepID=UPI0022258FCC|nr:uncharacterized protein KGF54_005487 [Candida jiufengensis]KAI5949609.1 hypothetical protein KGF54_005487 [Candida jiufengensis]
MSLQTQQDPPKVLRIKRKRGQDPLQALILEDTRSIKKSKPSTPISSPKRPSSPINYLNNGIDTTPSKRHPIDQFQQRQKQNENLNYLFKLSKTEDDLKNYNNNETILNSVLSETSSSSQFTSKSDTNKVKDSKIPTHGSAFKRRFVIQPQGQKRSIPEDYGQEIGLSNEVSSMINDYVSNESTSNTRRKKRGGKSNTQIQQNIIEQIPESNQISSTQPSSTTQNDEQLVVQEDEDDDTYVYDVYHLIDSEPLTTANHPKTQIGYIRFFNDLDEDESFLLTNDSADDLNNPDLKKPSILTDDEDSNAESFYQNDYPSDEDLEGLEELNNSFEDEFNKLNINNEKENDDYEYEPHDGIGFNGDEYFDYGDVEKYMDLQEQNNYEDDEEDDDGYDNDEPIKRNEFFKSDRDDPIAIHRDKIFNKLEKMINE